MEINNKDWENYLNRRLKYETIINTIVGIVLVGMGIIIFGGGCKIKW